MTDIKAWIMVFFLGILKLPFKILAPFVVPFLSYYHRVNHPFWGVRDATDLSWWNIGVRNSCHNMVTKPMPTWKTVKANSKDSSLEQEPGFQWRYRRSDDGRYVSFRMTWGEPRKEKGKREFYIGWTLNQKPYMRLTFAQFRPW